jgi:hypothetical protein
LVTLYLFTHVTSVALIFILMRWDTRLITILAFVIMSLGIVSNFTVYTVNGESMPVFSDDPGIKNFVLKSSDHHFGSDESRLWILSDIINVPFIGVFSIGDFFILSSFGLFVASAARSLYPSMD